MKILALVLTVLLAGCNLAIAQSPYATRLPAELQTAQMDSLADVTWLQGTTPAIRVEPLLRGRPVAVDADTTVRMVIGPSATGTLYAVRTNLATVTNAYEIQWPTIGTNSAGEAWFYTLFFDRDGYTYWSGSGKLYIEETTSTASNGIEWIEYTSTILGATVNEPHTVATNDGILAFTVTADGSGFPLTNNADMAKYSLTNGLTVQATNGQFKTLAVSGGNTTLGALTAGNTTIQGNLTVTGTTYNITTVNISTNYYVGVSTTYVDEVRYSTNYTYTYVYTNIVSTNTVNTYVDVGGTWDASNSAWAAFPHFVDTASGNLVGIGTWDFTGATLIGLPAQGVTNIGSSMTGNGLETALDVDWSQATTNALSGVAWDEIVAAETDPLSLHTSDTNAIGPGLAWDGSKLYATGEGAVTNEIDPTVYDKMAEAHRDYATLALTGGTALVSRASGRWLMIEADNGEVTLDVDAASYTDPLEAIQHQICWVRGTNETYAVVTNNIDNTLFVDLPASTTNHLFLERRPGWPRFQIWQDFR